ncbi:MAG: polysaccharide pyruvyl transferase family protein [Bacteroidetes bacterium HGW-Bacteroidetes-23]|nr:MAG: polysaccharide pyruvyl transferase family protein [Bacteroidetes bacterium HGW-Bacteroidetes-23]
MNKIPLYWYSENREGKGIENFGDLASPYLIEKLSARKTTHIKPNSFWYRNFLKHFLSTGSILGHANANSVVWGSGIIQQNDSPGKATFLAVRGPKSRQRLCALGYQVPEKYGDPALLLPKVYLPEIVKTHKLGIIPHYTDFKAVKQQFEAAEEVKIIDVFTHRLESVLDEIMHCEQIVSSSLHGVIVAHAYGIPAVWVKFSDKLFGDNIKFYDYFASVEIEYENEFEGKDKTILDFLEILESHPKIKLPKKKIIQKRQNDLLQTFPFPIRIDLIP